MSNIRMPCDTSDQAHRTSSSHAGSNPCQQSFRISNPLRLLTTLLQRKTTELPFITSSLFQPTDYLFPFGRTADSFSCTSYLQSCRSNARARGAFFSSLAALAHGTALLHHMCDKGHDRISKELLDNTRRRYPHHRYQAVDPVSSEHPQHHQPTQDPSDAHAIRLSLSFSAASQHLITDRTTQWIGMYLDALTDRELSAQGHSRGHLATAMLNPPVKLFSVKPATSAADVHLIQSTHLTEANGQLKNELYAFCDGWQRFIRIANFSRRPHQRCHSADAAERSFPIHSSDTADS
jgi:hypothetical protein